MPVKIRLQRRGRKKKPFYHIVIADARAPRDGKFIEKLGIYNPMTKPATIEIDRERAYEWLTKGAQPTDTVRAILRLKGVMYRKHLMRGVDKGAMTQEEADLKWQAFIDDKESKIAIRKEATDVEIAAMHAERSGIAPVIVKEAPTEEEHAAADRNNETLAEAAERKAAEEAPAVEEVKEEAPAAKEVKEEAPAPVVVEEVKEEAPAAKEVKEEAPAPVVEEVKEEAPAAKEVKEEAPAAKEAKPDKLTKIEGIGPKISEVLQAGGINTFAQLAEATPESVKEMLNNAEGNFAAHDPATWPDQAKMAAAGEWDKLKEWQDALDGGKVK